MKKLLLALLICISGAISAQTYGWLIKDSLPAYPTRTFAVSFSIGNKGYVATGANGSWLLNDVWEYDVLANNWVQKNNFPGGARYAAVAFTIGNKAYIATGFNGSTVRHNDLWEYNQSSDTWTKKADFPGGAVAFASAFSIGSKGYIIIDNPTPGLWEWDQSTNTWSSKSAYPGFPTHEATCFTIGTKAYYGTGAGSSAGGASQEFWEWDQPSNAWTQKATFAGPPRRDAVAFSIGTKGYIGIGGDNLVSYQDFWEYDPSANTWTQILNYPGSTTYGGSAFVVGSKAYVGFGNNELFEFLVSSTGVKEISQINSFSIYPNPSSGKIRVKNIDPHKLKIINALGEEVKGLAISGNEIDLSKEAKGLYFIEISGENKKEIKKLIIE